MSRMALLIGLGLLFVQKTGDFLPLAARDSIAVAPGRTLRVVVFDPDNKPLADANVKAGIWTKEKDFKATRDYKTDATGAAQVELPATYYIVRLWAESKGFVSLFANWEEDEFKSGKELPKEFAFKLERGTRAGGRIVDEQGKPIAGVRVQVSLVESSNLVLDGVRTRYNTWLSEGSDAAKTDQDGRWSIENVPTHPKVELGLMLSHPDYVSDRYWQESQKAAGVTTAMLREGTATVALKTGVVVYGRITDPDGKPIKGALVVHRHGNQPSGNPSAADGGYRLFALKPQVANLTVIAPGWAPQTQRVNLQVGLPAQDFRLQRGRTIRLRIVDSSDQPVAGAFVTPGAWKGTETFENLSRLRTATGIPRKADAQGIWEWTWAPADSVKLKIGQEGFAQAELEVAEGASEQTVLLKAEHRVTGKVTDAVTGQPIANFLVIPVDVFRKDWLHAERHNSEPCRGGQLDFLSWRTDIPIRLRVEAKGYRTQDGPEFRTGDDSPRVQNFRLQPSAPIAGNVVDAAGQPVAKADVLLATPTHPAELKRRDRDNQQAVTDAAGQFEFPDAGESFAVLVRGETGYAFAEFPADQHDAGTLRLQPWASIRGQFFDGGKPVRGARIILDAVRIDSLDRPRLELGAQAITGPDGSFEFARVPPVPMSVRVYLGPWEDAEYRSGPSVPLDLRPGEQAVVNLGSGGAMLTGKVKLTGPVPADLDCNFSLSHLVRRAPGIAPPTAIASLGFDIKNGWRDTWHKTSEGRAYLSTLQSWFVKLAPDGSFQISGVPPGEYDLAIEVYAKPSGCLVDPLAREVVHVTVTADDAARGTLVIPEIAAEVTPVPSVGDTPVLSFVGADGKTAALKDYRGRHTLIHFWASWCGPCKAQLPAVKRLHEQYAPRGLNMVGVSLDEDPTAWQAALKRLEFSWSQGRLDGVNTSGVSSVPVYWLLDPDGKIVAKGQDTDELAAPLAERLK